jgi:hypothetical protein
LMLTLAADSHPFESRCRKQNSGAVTRTREAPAPDSKQLLGCMCRWFRTDSVFNGRSIGSALWPQNSTQRKKVLIFWTGNSATSQMAEGLLRHDAGEYFEVERAGTRPESGAPRSDDRSARAKK